MGNWVSWRTTALYSQKRFLTHHLLQDRSSFYTPGFRSWAFSTPAKARLPHVESTSKLSAHACIFSITLGKRASKVCSWKRTSSRSAKLANRSYFNVFWFRSSTSLKNTRTGSLLSGGENHFAPACRQSPFYVIATSHVPGMIPGK